MFCCRKVGWFVTAFSNSRMGDGMTADTKEGEGLAAAHKLIDLSDPMTTAEERKEAHAAMDAMAAMAKAEKDAQ